MFYCLNTVFVFLFDFCASSWNASDSFNIQTKKRFYLQVKIYVAIYIQIFTHWSQNFVRHKSVDLNVRSTDGMITKCLLLSSRFVKFIVWSTRQYTIWVYDTGLFCVKGIDNELLHKQKKTLRRNFFTKKYSFNLSCQLLIKKTSRVTDDWMEPIMKCPHEKWGIITVVIHQILEKPDRRNIDRINLFLKQTFLVVDF